MRIYTQEAKDGCDYMSVFDYSVKHGGTYDGFRYYNDIISKFQRR